MIKSYKFRMYPTDKQEIILIKTIVQKDLSVRIHNCICGLNIDRDHNAAINILNRGMKYVPTDCGEFKPVERRLNETGSLIPLG